MTQLNSNLTSRAVAATISLYNDNGISFDRKHTFIRGLLDGYQSLRPPDERIKLPLCEYHIWQTFIHFVDANDYANALPCCALLIAYSLLLRPEEVEYQPR